MNDLLGAELTALSAPYGYGQPWFGHRRPFFGYRGNVFVGGDAPLPRSALTSEVAPVLAPATGGISVRSQLDDRQVLHVEICVDSKCYSSTMDLAPAIAGVMAKLARYHSDLHKAMPVQAPVVSGDVVIGAVEQTVDEAVDVLVGELVDHHIYVASAGWLDDVKGGFTKLVNTSLKLDVLGIHNKLAPVVKKFKGPITLAATAAATAYGGPLAGAAAGKLVGPIIDQTAEFGKKKDPKLVAAEKAAQAGDPVAQKALKSAQDAVAEALAAKHVETTAKSAAAGNPAAKQDIARLVEDAEKGDPAAKATAPIVTKALSSGWYW